MSKGGPCCGRRAGRLALEGFPGPNCRSQVQIDAPVECELGVLRVS